jgi:succinate dehydrogenase / fumarate reductase, cytochrome b subunit
MKLLKLASVTQKIIMAVAGLFLLTFLLVHLAINLCLLRNDGGEWFNAAAHFMGTNYIVKVFEVVLILGFLIHVLMGLILQIQNWMARPVRYQVQNKSNTSFFSKYMIYTGIIIVVFLAIHFMNFYFIKLGLVSNPHMENGEPNFYVIVQELFAQPAYSIAYVVLITLLGLHLHHAFQSAFQTLGANHSKYTPAIKIAGTIYTFIIVIGFDIIPIYFLMFQ